MPVLMGLTLQDAYFRIVGGGSVLLGLPKESGFIIIFILYLCFVIDVKRGHKTIGV